MQQQYTIREATEADAEAIIKMHARKVRFFGNLRARRGYTT